MADALLVVPTRRRRKRLATFLEANDATRQADVEIIIAADEDDQETYHGMTVPKYARFKYGFHAGHTAAVNRHAVPGALRYPAVGMAGDDSVPETPGWDAQLLAALDTPGIAAPVSRGRGRIPEHWFISSPIISALGWALEPSMVHYWVDVVLHDIGNDTGCCRYLDHVQLRHDHYIQVPAVGRDEVYAEAEASAEADRAAYERWQQFRQAADAATVRRARGALREPVRPDPAGPAG